MSIRTDSRVLWVDAARGAGIVLVTFGHVWRGLDGAGLISDAPLFRSVDAAIYLFHMPLFFFVSGLFFEQSVRRAGIVPSLWQRVETLLYPLLIWSWVTAGFLILAGSLTNRPPISLTEAFLYPFPPKDIFWFLWSLFFIQTLASLFATGRTFHVLAVFAASFALLLALDIWPFPRLEFVTDNLSFFLAGVLLTRSGNIRFGLGAASGPVALLAFIACEVWATHNWSLLGTAPAYLFGLIATLSFCSFIAWVAALAPVSIVTPMSFLGRASIAIYVTHVIPLAAVRIILVKLGIGSLPVHILLGTVAGVVPGALIYLLLKRWALLRWFGLGRDRTKAAERPSPPSGEPRAA
ncbi:fucose 4-O-acetylase-like acetyltransferase [Mycoplana sp. BE70]|uniref:acyltransferase family protein n=1 Tax=Mycoplana sp. BE70 TaxID=2817775 RepID=UPI00285C95A0|nr:acyltransferase family protein [Mycoplana sp. BE70]MDR6758559.1 fucose 4-O-acetylase-like acetyltransferase [Mycoplana sp. BE70]